MERTLLQSAGDGKGPCDFQGAVRAEKTQKMKAALMPQSLHLRKVNDDTILRLRRRAARNAARWRRSIEKFCARFLRGKSTPLNWKSWRGSLSLQFPVPELVR